MWGRRPTDRRKVSAACAADASALLVSVRAVSVEWLEDRIGSEIATRWVTIYTDGACRGNPGPGGWAYVVVEFEQEVARASGRDTHTTNNRMELTAVAEALETHPLDEPLHVVADSTYVLNPIVKKWFAGWQERGWMLRGGKPVKNRELWERLLAAREARTAETEWSRVAGHSGHRWNELCDSIAVGASRGTT
jgi:ribonuclease HI